MRIALIDDSHSALVALQGHLRSLDDVELHAYQSGWDALVDATAIEFDLVICDYLMPDLDGIDVIRRLRTMPAYAAVPLVMITSNGHADIHRAAIEAGVTDFLRKPIDAIELLARVRNLLALRRAHLEICERAQMLDGAVSLANLALEQREEEILWRLARAVDARDGKTGEHMSRMAMICFLIAQELGLPPETCRTIYLAAPLHDVGKIGIPDAILSKPGRLTPEEYALMQRHVEIGVKILENADNEPLRTAEIIARGHHERWDGSGYPAGLAGVAIPLEARIAAVADVFEALCAERPYKPAWPLEEARDEILAGAGTLFDPNCVAAFLRCWCAIAERFLPVAASFNGPALGSAAA